MRHLTDGERDILAEQEADARDAESAWAEEEGDEHELSPGEWADVGHVDGYDGRRFWPPLDATLARHYAAGYSAGRHDRRTADATPPGESGGGDDDEIPF